MAIIDSLYAYYTEWKTPPPRINQCCRNRLQYPYQQIFNSRYKDISLVHLLSSVFINQSHNKVIDQRNNIFNNTYNNNSINTSEKIKKMTSNHSTSLMDRNHHHHHGYQHHQLNSIDNTCNHSNNAKFALIKLKRIYSLLKFLLNEKQLCIKHIELMKLFMKHLQTIIKQLEESNNEQLKHLIKCNLDVITREIITEGMNYMKDIINCRKCQDKSINDLSMIKQYNHELINIKHYNRKKYQRTELHNDDKIENTINRKLINFWSSHLSCPIDKSDESKCLNCSFIKNSSICLLNSTSLLSSSSYSSVLSSSSSSLSLSYSSPSTSLSYLTSSLTNSTYASISNISFQLSREETIKDSNNKSNQSYHCQISNSNNKNIQFDNKCMRDKLFVYDLRNVNEEEYKEQNHLLNEYIEEHQTPFCLVENKPSMKDSSNTNDSCQYTRQYNQNEIKNVKIHNLDEIYPYAVSRRPSVRDILRQQTNSFMHSQQHQTEKHQIYYPKQNRHFPSKESSNHLSTTTTSTTTTTTTSTDDDNHNKMLKSPERSNFYTSNDYINYPQLNLCVNRIDYLFSDHNLNMGVIPPPNLNPFTS